MSDLPEDDFSAAFGEATGDTPVEAVAAPAPVEEVAPPEAPAEVAPVAEAPAEVAPVADAPVAEAPAEEPPAAPAQEPLDPQYLAQAIAEAQQRMNAPAPQQQQAPRDPASLTLEDFMSDADKEALKAFDAEWDEVAPAIDIKVRAAVQLALTQARAQWESQLAPIAHQMQRSQATSHDAAILAQHPDLESIKPGVVQWIAGQPAIMRPALEQVATRGTAAQVIELLDMYKKAIGVSNAAPAPPASSAAQGTVTPPAVSAAAAATAAVVTGKRGTVTAQPNDDDFESAWREAANS